MRLIKRFVREDGGATSIEYAIIVSSIALAVIVAIQLLGINLADTFWTLANTIGGALGGH
ncbi:MAG TPA: Flp family type IVb pilin [Hyphomonadaceae bacterium]|nr:Flp family type IVb pilin [Hyphomonadaceae bacterium]